MRLRLSDLATSAVLADHYRMQAEVCQQLARITVSPVKEVWLELAGVDEVGEGARRGCKAALISTPRSGPGSK
jgi:hypothetical protein